MYNLPAIWQKRGYLNIGAWCQKLDLRTCRLRPVRRRLCPLRSTCIHMHWHHRGVIPLKYLLRVQRINLLRSQMNLFETLQPPSCSHRPQTARFWMVQLKFCAMNHSIKHTNVPQYRCYHHERKFFIGPNYCYSCKILDWSSCMAFIAWYNEPFRCQQSGRTPMIQIALNSGPTTPV